MESNLQIRLSHASTIKVIIAMPFPAGIWCKSHYVFWRIVGTATDAATCHLLKSGIPLAIRIARNRHQIFSYFAIAAGE